jgi:hypothetical protein
MHSHLASIGRILYDTFKLSQRRQHKLEFSLFRVLNKRTLSAPPMFKPTGLSQRLLDH